MQGGLTVDDNSAWLTESRGESLRRFQQLGLPSRRDEAWRFTDLRGFNPALPIAQAIGAPDAASLAAHLLPAPSHRIVLVNGAFCASLSDIGDLPEGVWLASLSETITCRPDLAALAFDARDHQGAQPFTALNAAQCTDGFVLVIAPGIVLDTPVEVLHVSLTATPQACQLRHLVTLGAGAQATLVESFIGGGPGWSNIVTSIELAATSILHHAKLQDEALDATHFALSRARLANGASYDAFALITGARLSRQDVQVALLGEAARFVCNAIFLLRGTQEGLVAPVVDHAAPGGETSELVKGVLADRAHGVFLGTILVREGADGTDARQLNRNLMTSAAARMDTRPELTIHADEVKCSHGATVGDLDDAALFYLVSRGIEPVMARHMLMEAFATEVIDVATLHPAADALARAQLQTWLDTAEPA